MPQLRSVASRRALAVPLAIALAATFAAAPLAAQGAAAAKRAPVTVHWLGHAAFEVISAGGTRILIDPFLTGNPTTPDSLKQLARYNGATKPAVILVSHSHF
ncbi:MAG TPA: MBL fold metallo-hydrolase, partial [Gemmatimonadaceae bacterium]